jgi:hypothetical protein
MPCRSRALDAPAHGPGRRAGATAAVPVEQQGTIGLPQHTHLRAGIQLAVAIELAEEAERRDTVVGMAAQLGVDKEPRQPGRVLGGDLEPLEHRGETGAQVVDVYKLHKQSAGRERACRVTAPAY